MPTSLQELIERLGGRRRALILLTGVLSVVAILGVSRWATAPTFVPAFTGLPLESIGQITQKLDEEGIAYELDQGGGVVKVSSDDLARARVALARQGLPSAGRPGLELFDQPSWGMTDFAQRINYRRALEGELERTIGKMQGIQSAQVHLAIHETSSFRSADRPTEASVVLKLAGTGSADPGVVQGIAHLVASSVDGLESSNVAVLDDTGRLLSSPAEAGSLTALTSQQLSMQREVEAYLEGKAETLLAQFVGRGNTRIQVSASLNFDRVERTTESVDPEKQVLASEQRSEIVPGTDGGAGSTTSSNQYQNSRSVETFAGAPGNLTRLTVAVLVNDRMKKGADGAVTFEPRTAQEIKRIETLVRSAVGVDERRGDLVSVVSVPFDGAAALAGAADEKRDLWTTAQEFQRPALTLFALLLAAFVAMRVLRALRPPTMPALVGNDGMMELPAPEPQLTLASEPVQVRRGVPVVNTIMRDRVVASVEEHPNLAARLVRAWMREG